MEVHAVLLSKSTSFFGSKMSECVSRKGGTQVGGFVVVGFGVVVVIAEKK